VPQVWHPSLRPSSFIASLSLRVNFVEDAVCGLPLFDFGRGRPQERAENPDLWVMCDKRSGRGHT